MEAATFRFKKFSVTHQVSSMKVGVDAVLLGAWAGEKANKILEVGTGCGVISLILAQRFPDSVITAIDVDIPSVEEAAYNFRISPWFEILTSKRENFPEETLSNKSEKYDLIVSNPPYFRSGISDPQTRRERARHQGSLSVFSLIEYTPQILTEGGRLSMIFPVDFYEELLNKSKNSGFTLKREIFIRNNKNKGAKRVMIELEYNTQKKELISRPPSEELILFEGKDPTPKYKELCGELYLKF